MFIILIETGWEIAVHLAVAGDVIDGVFLCCPFFTRDVLDEILDFIEFVSEGLPIYFYIQIQFIYHRPRSQFLRVFLPTFTFRYNSFITDHAELAVCLSYFWNQISCGTILLNIVLFKLMNPRRAFSTVLVI